MKIVRFSLSNHELRAEYDAFFESCSNAFIQQSTLWAEVIADLGPDEPIFLLALAEDKGIAGLPLYLFRQAPGAVLTSVPQAGPLGGIFFREGIAESLREECYSLLIDEAVRIAQEHSCISISITTNPLSDDRSYYRKYLKPDYILNNFTQVTDLHSFFDAGGGILFPDWHRRSNLSRNINKAQKSNFRIRLSDDPAEIPRLYDLHLKRHKELQADPVDIRLFTNIAKILIPANKAFIVVLESDATVASWAIYIKHRDVLDVLRLNMDSAFSSSAPNFLNTYESLRRAFSAGVRYYNWQSSPSRQSGVFRYKQQWGGHESTYSFMTRIFCEPSYLAQIGLEGLQRLYPLHFVAPYAASDKFLLGEYTKS